MGSSSEAISYWDYLIYLVLTKNQITMWTIPIVLSNG